MKIAQVAPLWESVPPQFYGGTERVVSFLTEELVKQGHKVTLFASGDSKTSGRLIAPCSSALRLNEKNISDPTVYFTIMLEQVFKNSDQFDLIHFHIEHQHYPLFRRLKIPFLTTIHSNLGSSDLVPLYHEFSEMPVVAISQSQRKPLAWLNWQGTVYHGLPSDLYSGSYGAGQYLAFLGRISPEKGVDKALEIARRVGMKIRIAAKIGTPDLPYYENTIKPLLENPLVEFIGEIGDEQKNEFLGNAHALLFPIDWQEPFGMVMIEAMACGTPVIAFNCGSVPEVVQEGVTGFICTNIEEAVEAVAAVGSLSRQRIREIFESRFSAKHMADNYLHLYNQILRRGDSAFCIDRMQQSVMQ